MASTKVNRIIRMIFIVTASVIGILMVCVIGFFVWLAYFSDMCDMDMFAKVSSPDGKLSVVVYTIDCGVPTGFNTQVALVPRKKDFHPSTETQFLHLRGLHDLRVHWLDEATVEISGPAEAFEANNVIWQENEKDGVAIRYK